MADIEFLQVSFCSGGCDAPQSAVPLQYCCFLSLCFHHPSSSDNLLQFTFRHSHVFLMMQWAVRLQVPGSPWAMSHISPLCYPIMLGKQFAISKCVQQKLSFCLFLRLDIESWEFVITGNSSVNCSSDWHWISWWAVLPFMPLIVHSVGLVLAFFLTLDSQTNISFS